MKAKPLLIAACVVMAAATGCKNNKKYEYVETVTEKGLFGGSPTEKDKAPASILAANDSLAYAEAYQKFCISLELWRKMVSKGLGEYIDIPTSFKLYDENGKEVYVAIQPDKLEEIEKRVRNVVRDDGDSGTGTQEQVAAVDSSAIEELSPFFNFNKDEFDPMGRTWIKPKSAPKYTDMNGMYCYFMKTDDGVSNFRFRVQYYAEDWLFIRKCQFSIDGKAYEYIPGNVERDNGGGNIWEWFDDNVSTNDCIELIKALSQAKSAKVKFVGRQYYNVRTIQAKDILNIKRALDLYTAMGGRL